MSLVYQGVIINILGLLFQFSGHPMVDSEALGNFVTVAAQIIGAIMALWGRYRLGGITPFGKRV